MGYCDNCGQYIDDLRGVYNSLMSDLSDATDKLSEAMETMHLTSSYYDTKYVAQANQINYETKEFLNAAADEAYKYDEFSDVAYKIRNAAACIYYFDTLTEKTGFGSYEYETAISTSLGNCAQSLGDMMEGDNLFSESRIENWWIDKKSSVEKQVILEEMFREFYEQCTYCDSDSWGDSHVNEYLKCELDLLIEGYTRFQVNKRTEKVFPHGFTIKDLDDDVKEFRKIFRKVFGI